jgi:hypothetical protein
VWNGLNKLKDEHCIIVMDTIMDEKPVGVGNDKIN